MLFSILTHMSSGLLRLIATPLLWRHTLTRLISFRMILHPDCLLSLSLSFACITNSISVTLSLSHCVLKSPNRQSLTPLLSLFLSLIHTQTDTNKRHPLSHSIPWLLSCAHAYSLKKKKRSPVADYHCLLHCQNFLLPLSHSESNAHTGEKCPHWQAKKITWKCPDMDLCMIQYGG